MAKHININFKILLSENKKKSSFKVGVAGKRWSFLKRVHYRGNATQVRGNTGDSAYAHLS